MIRLSKGCNMTKLSDFPTPFRIDNECGGGAESRQLISCKIRPPRDKVQLFLG